MTTTTGSTAFQIAQGGTRALAQRLSRTDGGKDLSRSRSRTGEQGAVTKKTGFVWHLRMRMAERGMFQTTDLVPLLAERGVSLSREQVYRLVTNPPQRLSMDVFAALCDVLDCTPNDLVEITVEITPAEERAHEARDATGDLSHLPLQEGPIGREGVT